MCSSDLLLGIEARQAKTDAFLLLTVLVAMGGLAEAWMPPLGAAPLARRRWILFWAAIGVGILIKGPIVLMVAGLAALVLAVAGRSIGWLGRLRPWPGILIALAIALPWLVAITISTHGAFIAQSLGDDMAAKLAGAKESHGAPPGAYLAMFPVTFWPGSLFALLALPWVWRNRRDRAVIFCLAWIIPSWLVFEAVPTKLPHYVVPLYPALALLAAKGLIAAAEEGMAVPRRWAAWLPAALWALVAIALAGALVGLPLALGHRASFGGGVAAAAVLAGLWHLLWHERARPSLGNAGIAVLVGLLVMGPAFAFVLPRIDAIWLSRSAAYLVGIERLPGERVVSSGYSEPSLVFLLGTDTGLVAPAMAAADLIDGTAKLALVADRQQPDFDAALKTAGRAARPFGAVRGFDYSNGRWITLRLYRLAPAAP